MKATEQFAKTMCEGDLSELIRVACKRLNLLAYHTHNSKFSASGYPDWHIVGPSRSIFRELKTERGRLSVDQVLWIERLTGAGSDVAVWRPSQWYNGHIMRELRALASGSPDGPGGSKTGVTSPPGDVRTEASALLDSGAGTDRAASAETVPAPTRGGA